MSARMIVCGSDDVNVHGASALLSTGPSVPAMVSS
jgi:hypothetical protein